MQRLARLAVGPGTKATYCPGPKGCRDKWPGTKAYSVVVGYGFHKLTVTKYDKWDHVRHALVMGNHIL